MLQLTCWDMLVSVTVGAGIAGPVMTMSAM